MGEQRARERDDAGGENLPRKLDERPERVDVVDDADHDDDGNADDHADHAEVVGGEREQRAGPDMHELEQVLEQHRRRDAAEHGEAAHARDGLLVDAPRAGLVHRTNANGESSHGGHKCSSHRNGNGEDDEVVYPGNHADSIEQRLQELRPRADMNR